MTITGHETRAVFGRYHLVAPEDPRATAGQQSARPDNAIAFVPLMAVSRLV